MMASRALPWFDTKKAERQQDRTQAVHERAIHARILGERAERRADLVIESYRRATEIERRRSNH
jgi:hypothetical protein